MVHLKIHKSYTNNNYDKNMNFFEFRLENIFNITTPDILLGDFNFFTTDRPIKVNFDTQ